VPSALSTADQTELIFLPAAEMVPTHTNGDEPGEERVFDQVLALLIPHK
jgi:hypothetical protein